MGMALPPDFKDFLKLLNQKRIKYLLIGGYAVGYHGYPRATNDLNIWIAIDKDNAGSMVLALEEFGFKGSNLTKELFLKKENIVRLGIAPIRIEILTAISGAEFEDCFQNKIVDEFDGIDVNIISLNDLKKNKRAAGRYKDLDDLENLP